MEASGSNEPNEKIYSCLSVRNQETVNDATQVALTMSGPESRGGLCQAFCTLTTLLYRLIRLKK